ncbi:hypothetical protein HY857_00920 [Candidatus Saccharibacteria bacterium]|nr:hypothetical protein [Candidatus Saccharibacteria bacterium]
MAEDDGTEVWGYAMGINNPKKLMRQNETSSVIPNRVYISAGRLLDPEALRESVGLRSVISRLLRFTTDFISEERDVLQAVGIDLRPLSQVQIQKNNGTYMNQEELDVLLLSARTKVYAKLDKWGYAIPAELQDAPIKTD